MESIATALKWASAQLAAASATPRLDAEVLLAHLLERDRSYLIAWPERPLTAAQRQRWAALIERRRSGEPLAYLTGEREFWSLTLQVTPQVLIPRPETELLVEQALARLPFCDAATAVDLGTGSGAIALALAAERPRLTVVATDSSAAALAVAAANAERLGIHNVEFRHGSWCDCLAAEERVAVIVSNPPYLAAEDSHLPSLEYEPQSALVAEEGGLGALRAIIRHSGPHLRPGGWLLLEHGWQQGAAVMALLRQHGYQACQCLCDGEGRERVSLGRWPDDRARRP